MNMTNKAEKNEVRLKKKKEIITAQHDYKKL